MMRTGIDILFDKVEARGEARGVDKATIEVAFRVVKSGMDLTEVCEILQLTEEQVNKLEARLAEANDFA